MNALENAGEEATLHKEYSGRGMHGKTTVAVSFDHYCLLIPAILDYIKDYEIPYQLIPELGKLSEDNLGRGIILY